MRHHFDCDLGRDKIRFYPQKSSVHGFDEICPTKWKDVYKTYFTWEVLYDVYEHYKYGDDKGKPLERVYYEHSDEGEGLIYLRQAIREILDDIDTRDDIHILPFGYGTEWHIHKHGKDSFYIYMSHTYGKPSAYCLYVNIDDLQKIYCTLDNFLEYMLEHSEGI